MFVDIATISIKAGHGGPGCVSFHREKYVPKGGPNGGDGGDGGSVIFVANHNLKSLMDFNFQKSYEAQSGSPGEGRDRYGRKGEDLIIRVPVGTVVKDPETEAVIFDFTQSDQTEVLAKGGLGGQGNARFATSTNQTPFYAQKGLPGESRRVTLELKLIADVGIIGLPNAGKSSLLAALTRANVKIADYPFTTLYPNLGVLYYEQEKQVLLADLPGIIEGAAQGLGLGHQFLRHADRTKLLLHVLDVSDFYDRDCLADYHMILSELEQYSEALKDKPQWLILNKMDAVQDIERFEALKAKLPKTQIFEVSAITGLGLEELKAALFLSEACH